MNKLYNKIYKAVNEGIQKALLFDPLQNDDVSINYSYHKINNNVNILNQYVKSLLNNEDDAEQIYQDIINCYDTLHTKYKVKNFNELSQIFNIINDLDYSIIKRFDWIDFSDTITFITYDNSEIYIKDYQKGMDVEFIKIDKIQGCNHPLIIHKKLLISDDGLKWVKFYNIGGNIYTTDFKSNEQKALLDFDGYNHTYHNKNIHNFKNYPAFDYAAKCSTDDYVGYLPAFGELMLFTNNYQIFKYILSILDITDQKIINSIENSLKYIWSSTEYSWERAYLNDPADKNAPKTHGDAYVMPFFKKRS